MFEDQAFRSWPLIFSGASVFAFLFGAIALLTELLFEGSLTVTPFVWGFATVAFLGYLGAAWIIRKGAEPPAQS